MIDIQNYEVTLIGGDISILHNDMHYATLAGGELRGLQCNIPEYAPRYAELLEKCRTIHRALLDIDFILRESRINNPG